MAIHDPLPFKRWAGVYKANKYISIESKAGYAMSVADPKGWTAYLDPAASDLSLGEALREALSKSRFVDPYKEGEIFDYHLAEKLWDEWVSTLMARYGYSSERQAVKTAMYCSVTQLNGVINMYPYRHTKLRSWEEIDPNLTVTVPETVDIEQLGAAMRLALSRCR